MNNKPDINDLFEAARRQEADRKRQQKLSDMIDQMAALGAENGERRTENGERRTAYSRHWWAYVGIAASILLLVTVGLHILFGDVAGTNEGPIVAKTQPVQPVVVSDTVPVDSRAAVEVVPTYVAPKHNVVLAENAVPSQPVEQPAEIQIESEPLPASQPEEPLLAEAAHTVPADTPQVAAARHRVFERTSSRLVCGSGCKPEQRQDPAANTPQVAFVNLAGNSTDFEVGSISF
jgi:hypothetical protein